MGATNSTDSSVIETLATPPFSFFLSSALTLEEEDAKIVAHEMKRSQNTFTVLPKGSKFVL